MQLQYKALKLYEEHFDEKHPLVAQNLHNIGVTLWSLMKYEEAFEYLLLSIKLYSVCYESHPAQIYTFDTLNDLTQFLDSEVRKKVSDSARERLLEVCREKFGSDHKFTLKAQSNKSVYLPHPEPRLELCSRLPYPKEERENKLESEDSKDMQESHKYFWHRLKSFIIEKIFFRK